MLILILVIISASLGATAIYFHLKPQLQTTQILNENIAKENERNELKNKELYTEKVALETEYNSLIVQKDQIIQHISDIQKQAEESANSMYETSFKLANERMSAAAVKMAKEYEEAMQQAEQEYIELMADCSTNASKELNATNTAIKLAEAQLTDLEAKVFAAIEAAKRQEEMETTQDFYRLNLPDIDIEEIIKLREVASKLRDSEPLNKVIWKVYYEKPYTDLIGRVVGNTTKTGIYKITNILNQKCYVGQAASISERWRQHIKRGIGAETPTRNKLYPAMLQYGVENFTFEIVEECPRAQLNEREDYWQNYFGAKEFGYSIK